jgi:hypothetical protein
MWAVTRFPGRAHRTRRPPSGGPRYGGPDALDAQIDDLLANIEAETKALPWSPGTQGRRARQQTRRLGSGIRRVWGWRRTTFLFASTLMVSTGIAIVTVYLASRVLGG